ncbi:hypothetical protein AB3S75_023453 [Citrus x aurantiifolia]
MSLPKKIKIFIWRAAKNLLPIAANLWKRKILAQPLCQLCGNALENTFHALVECRSARRIWKVTEAAVELRSIATQDILSVIQDLERRIGKADTEMVVAMFWVAWSARNQVSFKGKREDPRILAAKAESVVEEFKRVKAQTRKDFAEQKEKIPRGWSPPPLDWCKINVDAAINVKNQCAGLGVVIRDAGENFVADAIKVTKFHGDVTHAEVEAVSWGLSIAKHAELPNIITESDSQETIDLVNSKKSSKTEIQWEITEVQSKMKEFNAVKVQHISRSCNAIAHSLAKRALESGETAI